MKRVPIERYEAIRNAYTKEAKTMARIGAIYGLTAQRVWQIVHEYNTNEK